jgi:hypothetical protein
VQGITVAGALARAKLLLAKIRPRPWLFRLKIFAVFFFKKISRKCSKFDLVSFEFRILSIASNNRLPEMKQFNWQ